MAASGKFVLESVENYEAFLAKAGVPAELAAKMAAAKPTIEFTKTDTEATIKTIAGDKSFTNTVVFGKESPVDVAGFKYTITAKKTDSGYAGTFSVGGKTGDASLVRTDSGIVQTMTLDGVTSKKVYKKA